MATPERKSQLLSIIIPCYNEEEVIAETMKRLDAFRSELIDLDVELIFVDDGSKDRTRELLTMHAEKDSKVRVISFARNFGQQAAITAGLDACSGDAVVILDADLQDPPEVIHSMITKWREGYDVVYGTRTARPGESAFKLTAARVFYRLLNWLSDVPIPVDTGDFRLITRPIVDALRAMPERDRYFRGLVSWVGFKQTCLTYKRAKRFAGKSKYSLKIMLHCAADGILSFSTKPLQISTWLGGIATVLALASMLYVLAMRVFFNQPAEDLSVMAIALIFFGGVQLVSIGILGEYVGRIYQEIKRRPLYIAEEYKGFEHFEPKMTRSPVGKLQK